MLGNKLCASFIRLSLKSCNGSQSSFLGNRLIFTSTYPLLFKGTPCLMAEPLKKKKRVDPAVVKQREERRKKKIERQIRRLEKNAQQLKPIEELEVPFTLVDEKKLRKRSLPALKKEVLEERSLLCKEWASYKHKEILGDIQLVDQIISSQQRALDELRAVSEELYEEAIQLDLKLIPFDASGPVNTPSIDEYDAPDGEYTNTSRKWD